MPFTCSRCRSRTLAVAKLWSARREGAGAADLGALRAGESARHRGVEESTWQSVVAGDGPFAAPGSSSATPTPGRTSCASPTWAPRQDMIQFYGDRILPDARGLG
jgi:hypothetical protein